MSWREEQRECCRDVCMCDERQMITRDDTPLRFQPLAQATCMVQMGGRLDWSQRLRSRAATLLAAFTFANLARLRPPQAT